MGNWLAISASPGELTFGRDHARLVPEPLRLLALMTYSASLVSSKSVLLFFAFLIFQLLLTVFVARSSHPGSAARRRS